MGRLHYSMIRKFVERHDDRVGSPHHDCRWIVIAGTSPSLFDRTLDQGMKIVDRFEGLSGRRAALIECPGDRLGFLPKLIDDFCDFGGATVFRDEKQARALAKKLAGPEA